MGKKSKRIRNKKTGNDAASATASASASAIATDSATATAIAASSASSGTNQCFHGSSEDKLHPNSEYMKAAQEYFDAHHQMTLLDDRDGRNAIRRIYDEDHMHLITDPDFHRFIFAYCTQQYLESNNLKDQSRWPSIKVLLHLGLGYRYRSASTERHKYHRDILTDRGIIKVLVRETKTHCLCMNEGKVIAKTMDIIGICQGCDKVFPKENLSFCSGCHIMKYHSRDCQLHHWHIHKLSCEAIAKVRNESNNRNIRITVAATLGWCLNAAGVHLPFQSSLSNDLLEAAKQLPAVDSWVQFVLGWGAIEWMEENGIWI